MCKNSTENTAAAIDRTRYRKAEIQLGREMARLVPDLEHAVPRSSGDRHAIISHTQTTHPIVVSSQNTYHVNTQKHLMTH